MLRFLNTSPDNKPEDYSSSIADMMTGLMIIFLFIAVCYMISVNAIKSSIDEDITVYNDIKKQLHDDLQSEFAKDLKRWGAEIERNTLTIRFFRENIYFDEGSAVVKPVFKAILDDFFPRYFEIIYNPVYRDHITEIRIEGHTSSEWAGVDNKTAYFLNMELSQNRTRETLKYILTKSLFPISPEKEKWIKKRLTANGLSSSKLIMENGKENQAKSRRVEFRIVTDADEKLSELFFKIKKVGATTR